MLVLLVKKEFVRPKNLKSSEGWREKGLGSQA